VTIQRRHLRWAAALIGALVLQLLIVPAAGAHAVLETSTPSYGAIVQRTPHELTLHYDEGVTPSLARVTVTGPAGQNLGGPPHVVDTTVTVPLRAGPKGSYTVRWRMVASDDGHVTEGAFSFGVRAKPVAPAPAKGVGIPVAPELLAWLQFLGIVLAGGVLTFRALVTAPAARMLGERERERRADDGRFAIAIGAIGATLALHAVLFGFLVGTYPVVGGSISNLVDTEIIPIRVSTHLGQAFTLSIFAWLVALALIVFAWTYPRQREPLLAAAGTLSLAIAFGLSWASHPASGGTLLLAADYAHLLAVALWVGGLIALVMLAGAARGHAAADREALFRACLIRFSALAAPLVALLAAAGLYLAIRELPSVSAIVDSRYGLLLVAKTATFAVAIGLAGYHRRSVVPRVAAGVGAASVRRTLTVEAGILLVALVLAAILSQSAPPR
jgi:copper transport protein